MSAEQQTKIEADDLSLIDPALEDQGKDDTELWAEFDRADGAVTSETIAETPDDPSSGDDGDGDAVTAQRESQSAADSAVKPDGQQQPPPDETPVGEKPSGSEAQPQDIWKSAAPDIRAAYDAARQDWERRDVRLRGQVSALQRQINDMTLRGRQAAPSGAADGAQQGGQLDGLLAGDEWKAFQQEHPGVAGPLSKAFNALQEKLTRQEKELSAIGNERRHTALREQESLLSEAHPDWADVTGQQAFGEWLDSQPRHIKEAAIRNANEIVDAEEAADVVGRFKEFRKASVADQQQPKPPVVSDDAGKPNQRPMTGKRQRQLESATAARTRSPGVANGIPEDGDPEAIWRMLDEQERRSARA